MNEESTLAEVARIIKHRSTLAPFECEHCTYIWYGLSSHHHMSPPDTVLCTRCWNALDTYIWEKYERFLDVPTYKISDEAMQIAKGDAVAWIATRSIAPLPRPAKKRFHKSVPKWMRSAIESGKVKTNGKEVYVVYSRESLAINVEIGDRSSLRPCKEGW